MYVTFLAEGTACRTWSKKCRTVPIALPALKRLAPECLTAAELGPFQNKLQMYATFLAEGTACRTWCESAKQRLLHCLHTMAGPCMHNKAANQNQNYITDCRYMQLLIEGTACSTLSTNANNGWSLHAMQSSKPQPKLHYWLQMHAIANNRHCMQAPKHHFCRTALIALTAYNHWSLHAINCSTPKPKLQLSCRCMQFIFNF